MTTDTKTDDTPKRIKGRTDVRYFHDGASMPESHKHKLSTLAYFHSRDLDTASPARISTKAFAEILRGLGVDDPTQPGWLVKLPNGITVECRLDGEPSSYDGPPPARKARAAKKSTGPKKTPAAKKQPAKKTPGQKARESGKATAAAKTATKKTAARKSAAKKTGASRQVTTRFKK